jgi:hypothetical protein
VCVPRFARVGAEKVAYGLARVQVALGALRAGHGALGRNGARVAQAGEAAEAAAADGLVEDAEERGERPVPRAELGEAEQQLLLCASRDRRAAQRARFQ